MRKEKITTNSPTWLNILFLIGFIAATGLSGFFTFQYFDGQIADKHSLAWWTNIGTGLLLEGIKNAGIFGFFHYILNRNFPVALACFGMAAFGVSVSLLATESFLKSNKSYSVTQALEKAKLSSPSYQAKLHQLRDSQKRSRGFTTLGKKGQRSDYHHRQDKARKTLLLSKSESTDQDKIINWLQAWENNYRSKYKQDHNSFFSNMSDFVTAGTFSSNKSGHMIWAGMIDVGAIIFLWLFMTGIRPQPETTLLQKCAAYFQERFPRAGDLYKVNTDKTVTNLNTGRKSENADIDNFSDKFSENNTGNSTGQNTGSDTGIIEGENTGESTGIIENLEKSQTIDSKPEKPVKPRSNNENYTGKKTGRISEENTGISTGKSTGKTTGIIDENIPVNIPVEQLKLLPLEQRKKVAIRMILTREIKPQLTILRKKFNMHQDTAQNFLRELSTGKGAILTKVRAAKNCRYELKKGLKK